MGCQKKTYGCAGGDPSPALVSTYSCCIIVCCKFVGTTEAVPRNGLGICLLAKMNEPQFCYFNIVFNLLEQPRLSL